MFLRAYCLLDAKTGIYSIPFFAKSHGEAVRLTVGAARQPGTQLADFPEDFVLFWVGEWDDTLGIVQGVPHESLGNLQSLLVAASKVLKGE